MKLIETESLRYAKITERVKALMGYESLGKEIESFWLDPEHRQARTWAEHRDINEVMLATSLVPAGFLIISSGNRTGVSA